MQRKPGNQGKVPTGTRHCILTCHEESLLLSVTGTQTELGDQCYAPRGTRHCILTCHEKRFDCLLLELKQNLGTRVMHVQVLGNGYSPATRKDCSYVPLLSTIIPGWKKKQNKKHYVNIPKRNALCRNVRKRSF